MKEQKRKPIVSRRSPAAAVLHLFNPKKFVNKKKYNRKGKLWKDSSSC